MVGDERYGLHQSLVDRFGERAGDSLFVAAALAIAVSEFAAYQVEESSEVRVS